jgi:hypothetical protein
MQIFHLLYILYCYFLWIEYNLNIILHLKCQYKGQTTIICLCRVTLTILLLCIDTNNTAN